MRLATTTQVSVDGVMQGNGPSEEDRVAGFERDGWAMGHFDNEWKAFVDQVYQPAVSLTTLTFATVLAVANPRPGRRTPGVQRR